MNVSKKTINNRKDILLLLLYSPGKGDSFNEPISGRTRLMKMLFIFQHEVWPVFKKNIEINSDDIYQFIPWLFGPFSREVYDDITFFMLRDFIESSPSQEILIEEALSEQEWEEDASGINFMLGTEKCGEYQEEEFKLTKKGEDYTSELYKTLSKSQCKLLKEFKNRTSTTPLRAILQYVYKKYPEHKKKSTIKEKVLHEF